MKKSQDQEIMRLQALVRALEEFVDRWYKYRRNLGEHSGRRARNYIADRFDWLFKQFLPPNQ